MTALVTEMYTKIIDFAERAVQWYGDSQLKHAITSFTYPYSLRFKDIVDDISEISRRIDKIALTMSMTELRQVRLALQELRGAYYETRDLALEMRKKLEGESRPNQSAK
jgi:hypothetical protein